MFYYRYRSGSELAIKELIYDELYFASREECNDPYEGKTFATFSTDEVLWGNLITEALKVYKVELDPSLKDKVVKYFVSKSPMPIENVAKISRDEFMDIGQKRIDQFMLKPAFEAIQNYVMMYSPEERYFASFSKKNDNFLLWSHYANNHSGFCLIYRAIDGKLKQHSNWKRQYVASLPTLSITFGVPDEFENQDVEYIPTPKSSDGFMCFPACVAGDKYTQEEIEEFRTEHAKNYLQKHTVWDYEEEARVVLSSGVQWFAGRRLVVPTHQRLFHLDSTQLVGIVLGTRMSGPQRARIKEIVAEKVDRWYLPSTTHRIISNFVLFEETLSETNREVNVEPVEIYTGTMVATKNHPEFARLYDEWKNGYAIEINGNSSKKVIVK